MRIKSLLNFYGYVNKSIIMAMPMIDNAKILSKGQITCENDHLVLMNSAVFALKEFQKAMECEAEKAGIYSNDDVDMIMQMRKNER